MQAYHIAHFKKGDQWWLMKRQGKKVLMKDADQNFQYIKDSRVIRLMWPLAYYCTKDCCLAGQLIYNEQYDVELSSADMYDCFTVWSLNDQK